MNEDRYGGKMLTMYHCRNDNMPGGLVGYHTVSQVMWQYQRGSSDHPLVSAPICNN